MKSKHIFTNLSYAEIEELAKQFPVLNETKMKKWGGGGFRWSSVPKELRNIIGKELRKYERKLSN